MLCPLLSGLEAAAGLLQFGGFVPSFAFPLSTHKFSYKKKSAQPNVVFFFFPHCCEKN